MREHIGLAGGVLRGRGREPALGRRNQRTVAKRPHAVVTLDRKLARHLHAAARFRHRKILDARMRRGRDRGDERAGRDAPPVGEKRLGTRCSFEAGIQRDLHAALPEDALREASEFLRHLGQDPIL